MTALRQRPNLIAGRQRRTQSSNRIAGGQRPNWVAGVFSALWLLIVIAPVYVLVKAAFQSQAAYSAHGPLSAPTGMTLDNFSLVFHSGFLRFFLNTAIITFGVVAIVLAVVPPAAYAIVRNRSRTVGVIFRVFLLGLAVPISAVIVPTFYIMNRVHLYDTLLAVILPSAAFSVPLSTIILTGAMRDITTDLFEAMALDGASSWITFRNLVLPLSGGGIATILVFSALNAWNGFLFPLILTQSNSSKVFTLGLYDFSSTSGIDAPAVCAAVVLSIIPILLVYLFARRWLIRGLMGAGGK